MLIVILFAIFAADAMAQQSQSPLYPYYAATTFDASNVDYCCVQTDTVFSPNVPPQYDTCSYRRRTDFRYYTDGLICPPSTSPSQLVDNTTYQIRSMFFGSGDADYTMTSGPYPFVFETLLKEVGLMVGNLHLSFSHQNTTLKMTYTPSNGSVSICGVAHGIIVWNNCYAEALTAMRCQDGDCTSFMNNAFYHFEMTVSAGMLFDSSSTPFRVVEEDAPSSGSIVNTGLFYPLGYPEARVQFGLINLTSANFDTIPEPWTSIVQPNQQMYITRDNATGLGLSGFTGLAGFKVRLDLLPAPSTTDFLYSYYKNSSKVEIMSTVINGIYGQWPIYYTPSSTKGNGYLMFYVEHSCNRTDTCVLFSSEQTTSESPTFANSVSPKTQDKEDNSANLIIALVAGAAAFCTLFPLIFIIRKREARRKQFELN